MFSPQKKTPIQATETAPFHYLTQFWCFCHSLHHVVFQRESVRDITSLEILQTIVWPKPVDDEDNDNSITVEEMSVITGYMRSFIEEASPTMLNHLMKFWVGWELPEKNLKKTC